ncbi:Vacuolar protein sorting 26 (Vps26) [Blattamonas nauphoetae]|uniref:Vacuolar protein sorting 26 (Vps26) n=1 Tax=Blattamonas nauphoetae TaxID=2049346 RepID=A0ABQ9XG81_9EUKA|nr:Vacuolar protein sorting 26 (Vps26) [Blattamonas nauphoetae]
MDKILQTIRKTVTSSTISIKLDGEETRRKVKRPGHDEEGELLPLYGGRDPVSGQVVVNVPPKKKLEHNGITIELVGRIEVFGEKSQQNNFISVVKELSGPGILVADQMYKFDFSTIKKDFETYYGINVSLKYLLIAKVIRKVKLNILEERELFVRNVQPEPDNDHSVGMSVGVKGELHIDFEYARSKYHLNDVIIGKVYFHDCKMKIKNMEIAILKKETCFQDASATNESDALMQFEVMDGTPVKNEIIPIRMYLSNLDLTPTYPTINSSFQVRYYLSVDIYNEEGKRFFKQQEITLWRKEL